MATSAAAKRAAAAARKAEARPEEAKPVEFEYDGKTYVVTPDALDNLELFEAVEDEKYLTATRGFLGKEQWERFKDAHRLPDGRVPLEAFEGFLQALMKAVGQGNSLGSSGS